LVVWNEAYRVGDNHTPPLRVRRIKTPRDPVDAFTHAELVILLAFVANLAGYFPNGVKRSDFWCAAIHCGYSTALRRGDLLKLRRDQIGSDGICRVRQNKTGYPITVKLSADALESIQRMFHADDSRALPWPYHPNALGRQFRRIVKSAGVRPGQFRWLRRSAASYSERDTPGGGSRILGHRSTRIFAEFYEDSTITQQEPPQPPPIKPK
jgi:integrase